MTNFFSTGKKKSSPSPPAENVGAGTFGAACVPVPAKKKMMRHAHSTADFSKIGALEKFGSSGSSPVKNIMLMDTSVTKRTYDATPESMGMSQAEFDASFRGGNHGGPKAKAPTRWTITSSPNSSRPGLNVGLCTKPGENGARGVLAEAWVGNGDGDGDGDGDGSSRRGGGE